MVWGRQEFLPTPTVSRLEEVWKLTENAIRLRSTVEVFDLDDGTIMVVPATGRSDFRIAPPNEIERYLLERLKEPVYLKELYDEVEHRFCLGGAVVDAYVEVLRKKRLIVDELPERKLDRYELVRFDRQLAYFESVELKGEDASVLQARLKSSKVLVFGCGGLGSLAAVELAAAGVGSLVLVDDDVVDLSNLSRQIVFCEEDIGKKKVAVLEDEILRRNSTVSVHKCDMRVGSAEELAPLMDGVDFLLLAGDEPPDLIPRIVDSVCARFEGPYLSISSVPPVVRVGPLFVGVRRTRWDSFERRLRSIDPTYDAHIGYSARFASASGATVWSMSIAVGFAVRELIGYLTNIGVSTESAYFLIDSDLLRIEKRELSLE